MPVTIDGSARVRNGQFQFAGSLDGTIYIFNGVMNPDPGTCVAQAATLEVDDVASLNGTTTFEGKVDAGFELSFAANDAKLSGEADIPALLPTAVRGAGYWFREANS